MSAIWLEKLRNANSEAERDEILLRDLREMFKLRDLISVLEATLSEDIVEQMRALSDLAFLNEA